jgi:hypothetical protein
VSNANAAPESEVDESMSNIVVGRYPNPKKVGGWAGYVQDRKRTWIMFIPTQRAGEPPAPPLVFLHRDPVTGAVLPDDPEERVAALAEVRAEQARRKAWVEPVPGVVYPCLPGEKFAGRAVPPSGKDPVE